MQYTTFNDLFHHFRYPAGESHVRLVGDLLESSPLVIEASARNFEDLCGILTADRILKRRRVAARWFVPYFPFARHDRRIDAHDGHELELALDLVRTLDITIADPHSDVSGLLRHIPQAVAVELFTAAGLFDAAPLVVIPDAGATKKALTWARDRELVQCSKRRDPRTGRLSVFEVPERDLGGAPCVIVDDICDGGGTFIGLAKALAARNAGPLTLAVTHGLFTKGTGELAKHFERVFTFARTGAEPPVPDLLRTLPFESLYQRGLNL